MCLLLLPIGSYGLGFSSSVDNDLQPKQQTLYEIGGVSACEDNFENLMRNWGTKYVTNADQIEILSYRPAGTLKNKRQIKKFIVRVENGIYATMRQRTIQNDDVVEKYRIINVHLPFAEFDSPEKFMNQSMVKSYLLQILTKGLNVYEITLTYNGVEYKHLVCCDPETMKIVGDTMFSFPVEEL